GEFAMTAALLPELESVTETTATSIACYPALGLAALAGREAEAAALIQAGSTDAERRGEGRGLTFIDWATAVLCNGTGRYEHALDAAQQATEAMPAEVFANWAAAELVEAATRIRVPERAVGALRRLSAAARASGTDWALGVEARSRALLSD